MMNSKSAMPEFALDDLNRRMLEMLHQNGRLSYTDIGRELGLSRVAVQNRVSAMVESQVIERFTIVVNPSKVGIHVSAFFHVEVEPAQVEFVAMSLVNETSVTSLYHMTGPSTLHMHAVFHDNDELESFLHDKLYALDGVTHVECQLLLKRYKSRIGLML